MLLLFMKGSDINITNYLWNVEEKYSTKKRVLIHFGERGRTKIEVIEEKENPIITAEQHKTAD